MHKPWLLTLALALPVAGQAADLANGAHINQNCALCHGVYGQGATGQLSPRLAGLPKEYLIKATKEYKEGKRINPLMVETAGLAAMTDKDIEDVAEYLATLELGKFERFNITSHLSGDAAAGKKLYEGECKSCHAPDGYGKRDKEAPPLAGQHSEYLFQSMKMFQAKVRAHDNDPKDDSFNEYQDDELLNMVAHVAGLDDPRVVAGAEFEPPKVAAAPAASSGPRKIGGLQITDIRQTVAQMELKPGVKPEDAARAMESKAVELNLKLVGRQDVSKELEARGVKSPYLSIFQFCNPMDARVMVVNNPVFASYMPCRISMVEDQQGKMWLMMLNLDMLINSELMPAEVVDTAIRVNQQMLDIMVSGATGEF